MLRKAHASAAPIRAARGPRARGNGRVAGIDYGGLDEYFGYALKRAQLAAFDAFSRATTGFEITPPRFTALVILEANPGITQSVLGEVLGTARSGAMLLTNWLVARGLAQRRHRPDDARAWGLYLTRRGRALVGTLRRRVLLHDRRFGARLTPLERRHFLHLLGKLAP
jgi:DNA-binding MarR family transcriptional regulator